MPHWQVALGKAEYVITEGTWFEDYLRDDKITAMQTMRKALETTPLVRKSSNQEALEYVRSKGPGEVKGRLRFCVLISESIVESLPSSLRVERCKRFVRRGFTWWRVWRRE